MLMPVHAGVKDAAMGAVRERVLHDTGGESSASLILNEARANCSRQPPYERGASQYESEHGNSPMRPGLTPLAQDGAERRAPPLASELPCWECDMGLSAQLR
jgi:hypothetical protein